jgi:hypothetical protein
VILKVRSIVDFLKRIKWEECWICGQPGHEYVIETSVGVMSARLCDQHAAQLVIDPQVVELVKVAR